MKRERPELSKKSLYHIPKHRYYELKHFCLQYEGWKNALTLIDFWEAAPIDMTGVIKGHSPESSTERKALARLYYLNCMHRIAEAVFDTEFEVIPTFIEEDAPECASQRLWYLGESIKKMADADTFIGIYDKDKEFDGCIVENYTAKNYNIPQYLVDIAYVAPDVVKKRMKRFV